MSKGAYPGLDKGQVYKHTGWVAFVVGVSERQSRRVRGVGRVTLV